MNNLKLSVTSSVITVHCTTSHCQKTALKKLRVDWATKQCESRVSDQIVRCLIVYRLNYKTTDYMQ